jgi:hypothetical protein
MSESKKCHLFCGGGVILQNGRGSSICIDLDDWASPWSGFLTYFISFPKRQKPTEGVGFHPKLSTKSAFS